MSSPYEELLQLTNRFFFCLDERRYAELVAMFHEDGVWHRMGKALKGHAEVMQSMEERARTQHTRHVVSNAFISEASEDGAMLIGYVTSYRYDDGTLDAEPPFKAAGPMNLMPIKISYTRRQGVWRIAEQWGAPEFVFPQ